MARAATKPRRRRYTTKLNELDPAIAAAMIDSAKVYGDSVIPASEPYSFYGFGLGDRPRQSRLIPRSA